MLPCCLFYHCWKNVSVGWSIKPCCLSALLYPLRLDYSSSGLIIHLLYVVFQLCAMANYHSSGNCKTSTLPDTDRLSRVRDGLRIFL